MQLPEVLAKLKSRFEKGVSEQFEGSNVDAGRGHTNETLGGVIAVLQSPPLRRFLFPSGLKHPRSPPRLYASSVVAFGLVEWPEVGV